MAFSSGTTIVYSPLMSVMAPIEVPLTSTFAPITSICVLSTILPVIFMPFCATAGIELQKTKINDNTKKRSHPARILLFLFM